MFASKLVSFLGLSTLLLSSLSFLSSDFQVQAQTPTSTLRIENIGVVALDYCLNGQRARPKIFDTREFEIAPGNYEIKLLETAYPDYLDSPSVCQSSSYPIVAMANFSAKEGEIVSLKYQYQGSNGQPNILKSLAIGSIVDGQSGVNLDFPEAGELGTYQTLCINGVATQPGYQSPKFPLNPGTYQFKPIWYGGGDTAEDECGLGNFYPALTANIEVGKTTNLIGTSYFNPLYKETGSIEISYIAKEITSPAALPLTPDLVKPGTCTPSPAILNYTLPLEISCIFDLTVNSNNLVLPSTSFVKPVDQDIAGLNTCRLENNQLHCRVLFQSLPGDYEVEWVILRGENEQIKSGPRAKISLRESNSSAGFSQNSSQNSPSSNNTTTAVITDSEDVKITTAAELNNKTVIISAKGNLIRTGGGTFLPKK